MAFWMRFKINSQLNENVMGNSVHCFLFGKDFGPEYPKLQILTIEVLITGIARPRDPRSIPWPRHGQEGLGGGCEWGAGGKCFDYCRSNIAMTKCRTCGHIFSEQEDYFQPCPKCGSLPGERDPYVHAMMSATATMTATAVLIKYPQTLIGEAEKFSKASEYGVSVIIAHTAAEIATERALMEITQAKGLPAVAEILTDLFRPFGITTNKKVRNFYSAISGDNRIAQSSFWSDLKTSDELRNTIIHRGSKATKEEAERAIRSTTELIKYLNQW
jgi:hypothetical protein